MRLLKTIGLLFAIILIMGVAGYTYLYLKSRPQQVVAFEGISLGDSKDSVFYALGPPSNVLFPAESSSSSDFWKRSPRVATKEEVSKAKNNEKSFKLWAYDRKETRLDVEFDDYGKVISIGCFQDPGENIWTSAGTCKVNGIEILDLEENVKKVLGAPDSESIEGVTKSVSYKKFNMRLFFSKKYLYYIVVVK